MKKRFNGKDFIKTAFYGTALVGAMVMLAVSVYNQIRAQTHTRAHEVPEAKSSDGKSRNVARQRCLDENSIKVDFKAGQTMNADQLAAMDKCMTAKGFPAGRRAHVNSP